MPKLTSNCSGVMALYCADDSFTTSASFVPFLLPIWDLTRSMLKTAQALAGAALGASRSAFSLKCFIFSLFFFAACAVFCLSVRTFLFGLGFGLGLALAFFPGLGLALSLGFALDLALGTALGAVVFGAGFLAALVAEVVGALL